MSEQLSGVDYSQYQNWTRVTTPSGGTYYQVPGTSYVYDPFLSQQKGRPVLWRNPQPEMDEMNRQRKLQDKASDPMTQLLPVAGTVGGMVGANYLIDALGPATAVEKLQEAEAAAKLAQMGGQQSGGLLSFLNGGTGASSVPMTSGVPAAPEIVAVNRVPGEAAGFLAPGSIAGNALGVAGTALGAYGAFQGIKNKDPLTAGMGGLGVAAGLSQLGWAIPGIGWAAAIGAPVIASLANKAFDQKSTKEIQADRWAAAGRPDLAGYSNIDYFAGTAGEQSRDEKYLTPDAIRINPDNYNNIPDWDSWTKEAQDQFLTRMLGEGKVSERKGGIYYDDKFAQTVANDLRSKGVAPAATVEVADEGKEAVTKKEKVPAYMNAGGKLPSRAALIDEMGQKLAKRMDAR